MKYSVIAFIAFFLTSCLSELDTSNPRQDCEGIARGDQCIAISDLQCGNDADALFACDETRPCQKHNDSYGCYCKQGLMACSPSEPCADLSNNPSHCGACFNRCRKNERCKLGKCLCLDNNNEPITAFDTDENCGFCGNTCTAPNQCIEGLCLCNKDEDKQLASCDEAGTCDVDLKTIPNIADNAISNVLPQVRTRIKAYAGTANAYAPPIT